MSELIAHMLGDFCFQNQPMAAWKPMSSRWAALHVAFYVLMFWLILNPGLVALAIIGGTHFIIDRFQLAGYWVRFYGIGEPGYLPTLLSGNNGVNLPPPAPPFVAFWLKVIVDNTFHVAINHWALAL